MKATIEGVVRAPSEFSMTLGLPPSITATHEFVVPRSIPITLAMDSPLYAQCWTLLTGFPGIGETVRQLVYARDIGAVFIGTRDWGG